MSLLKALRAQRADLPRARIEGVDDTLDPTQLINDVTVIIPWWGGIKARDRVTLHWQSTVPGGTLGDYIDIPVGWGNADVSFSVPLSVVRTSLETTVTVLYEVQVSGGALLPSELWPLRISVGFQAPLVLDLSVRQHVVVDRQPPPRLPDYAKATRLATWGQPPYAWHSGSPDIATVDASGLITAQRNGTSTITARDSLGVQYSFEVTVSGITSLHLLSPGADWAAMQGTCQAAGLAPVSRAQMRQLWAQYYPQTGPVLDYLDWLPYPVWTGDALGAGTAWAYDLNGASDNDNAQGYATDQYLMVVGASRPVAAVQQPPTKLDRCLALLRCWLGRAWGKEQAS